MIKKLSTSAAKAAKRLKKEDGGDDSGAAASDEDSDDEDEALFDREALEKDVQTYEMLWTEFGRALKLGASFLDPGCAS